MDQFSPRAYRWLLALLAIVAFIVGGLVVLDLLNLVNVACQQTGGCPLGPTP